MCALIAVLAVQTALCNAASLCFVCSLTVRVVQVRAPTEVTAWSVASDVEVACWSPAQKQAFFVSGEDGPASVVPLWICQ
jgi:hypothetical protein